MDDETGKFQFAAIKFLFDAELIDDPQLINQMKRTCFSVSPCVKDVEFLSSYAHRSMLIWLDLSWLGRKFLAKRIILEVQDRVQQLLPRFRFRVITDRKILDLALERVKKALEVPPAKGEKDEKPTTASSPTDSKPESS